MPANVGDEPEAVEAERDKLEPGATRDQFQEAAAARVAAAGARSGAG
jgi:hypothetical protein